MGVLKTEVWIINGGGKHRSGKRERSLQGWKIQECKTWEGTAGVEITEVETRRRRMHGRKTEEDLLWKAKYGVNA